MMKENILRSGVFILALLFLYACADQRRVANQPYAELAAEAPETAQGDMEMEVIADSTGSFALSEDKTTSSKTSAATWKRSGNRVNSVRLFVGETDALPLRATQIAVKVDGFRARVLMDLFFYNDRNTQLEGTFKLQLPNDASPYYFAFGESVILDKGSSKSQGETAFFGNTDNIEFDPGKIKDARSSGWSNVKEARIVPKEKAAFAYTSTVRASIDPALMEWAGADVFNCRVFPLMPGKLHRVVVGYDLNLLELDGSRLLTVPVPNTGTPMKINLDVASVPGLNLDIKPKINTQTQRGRVTASLDNPYMDELQISYTGNKPILLIDPDDRPVKHFALSLKADFNSDKKVIPPSEAILLLDISLSSNPDKFNVWLKMATALLKNNQAEIRNFNVLFFNIENFWWQPKSVANTSDNVDSFLEFASRLSLEGATDLSSCLDALTDSKKSDMPRTVFLLSDGAANWGESNVHVLCAKIHAGDRFFAFRSGIEGTNNQILNSLCNASGGSVFSILNESEIEAASRAFLSEPFEITSVSFPGASDILIAGRTKFVFQGQNLIITGKGSGELRGPLLLSVKQGGKDFQVRVDVPRGVPSELTARVFGQVATHQLEEFSYMTETYAKSFSMYYRVPGKTSSFLMLDTEEDYKRFNINPEENAYVVRTVSVSETISNILKDIGEQLANHKVMFMNWYKNLPARSGITFDFPTSLDLILTRMNDAAFAVAETPLQCKVRFRTDIRGSTLEELQKSELDYDIISQESLYRKTQSLADMLKVLSSLVEKSPSDGVLARDVAYTAMEAGLGDAAYHLFKGQLETRPYEPQTYHAMAKLLSNGNADLALVYFEICLAGDWGERYGDFKKIATVDYLRFLNKINNRKIRSNFADYAAGRAKILEADFPERKSELIVMMLWNTDNTDVDLHVIEPSGEECFYDHPATKSGGKITKDVTTGYGPEMYTLPVMKRGTYKIRAHYYSRDQNRTTVRTKVQVVAYKNWGTEKEKVFSKVVTLNADKEMNDVMEFEETLF